jgi:alkane 1-monooxygenase
MRYPLAYATSLITAAVIIACFYAGGLWLALPPMLIYFLLPLGEVLAGTTHWPSARRLETMTPATEKRYELALLLAAWTTVALLFWALWVVSHTPLLWWEFALLALMIGEFSGYVGIVSAHELMHRNAAGKRRFAFLLMALFGYSHFCIEHVRGHHSRVATPEDPATARQGDSLYRFVPRSIIGGFRSAWSLECQRLDRAGLARWSYHNDILLWHSLTLIMAASLWLLLGPISLLLFVAQALLAIFALEAINYLEHYGLMRRKLADGSYERVAPRHSWNSSNLISNINLFNLARHSDHHQQSNRPYYRLRHFADAPQLPAGYAGCFILSLVPPLWFRIMDRALDDFTQRQAARED